MLATNKTPLLDQQVSSKQFLFELIKVVYEVKEEKQVSIQQVFTIPEVAEILKCKTKTVEGHLYNARNLSYLKVGREVTLGRQIVDKGLDSTTLETMTLISGITYLVHMVWFFMLGLNLSKVE